MILKWQMAVALTSLAASAQISSPTGLLLEVDTEADAGVPSVIERTTVITGTRLPQQLKDSPVAIEVITRRQIRESGARDVGEILQARPGVETFQNVGNVGLRMQGLGPEYNVILIDGQRTAGRVNGGVDLSRLSVENIEQIEIVKGPSSVLWGSDALSGTVNIITRRPEKSLGGDVTASYGAMNQVDVRAGGEASNERWGISVNGGYRHRDAYDYDRSSPSTNGSSLDQGQGSLHASYGGNDKSRPSADLRLDFTRRSQAGIDSNEAGAVLDRRSRDNIFEGRLGGRIPVGTGAVGLSVGGTVFDRRFIIDQRDATALDDAQDTLDTNLQVDAQVDQKLGESQVGLAGGQLLVESLATPRLNARSGRRIRGAAFIQDAWSPTKAFTAVAGLRFDIDSSFGPAVTPRLAARFTPHSSLTIRGSTGLGFRAPTFQELMLDFENPSVGYVVLGNAALRPEHSFGSSIGAEWTPTERWLISVDGFWNELWDMISYASLTDSEILRFQYANIDHGRSRGIEASVGCTPVDGLMLLAGYTLTDARNLTEGTPIEGQSPHRWFGQARYRHRNWGVTAQVRVSVTGERPFADTVTTTRWSPAYALLDARVGKTFGPYVEAFVAGTNLLSSGNATDLPIQPLTVFGGLTVHY